jgi:hypothetical protein
MHHVINRIITYQQCRRTEGNYYTVDGVSANVGTGSNGSYTAGAAGLLPAQTALGTTQSMASVDALQVPDSALRQSTASGLQPVINAFPIANGAEVSGALGLAYSTAAYSAPSGLNTSSIRFDHTFDNSTHIFGRYSDSSSSSDSRSADDLAQVIPQSFVTRSVTSGLTRTFTPREVNDLRFNYTWYSLSERDTIDSFGGANTSTQATFLPGAPKDSQFAGFLFFGSDPGIDLVAQEIWQTQTNIIDTQQFSLGRHSLKIGVDYRRSELIEKFNRLSPPACYFEALCRC